MTKKSHGRQMRDLAKEEARKRGDGTVNPDQVNLEDNSCWDELHQIHRDAASMLAAGGNIAHHLRDRDLMSHVKNMQLLLENEDLLRRDMEKMNVELSEIYATHSSRTGGASDGQDLLSSYQAYEHYNLFTQRYNAVVMPTIYHLTEQIQEAENILENKRNETNVDVITDVEVKEVETVTAQ
jgi:hypothetical protein